uniref:Uncharacterized protein n=1 Tax=Caenorhabditis japonica TaxID=281687 RepID=A0A8R1EDM0_CAEJA
MAGRNKKLLVQKRVPPMEMDCSLIDIPKNCRGMTASKSRCLCPSIRIMTASNEQDASNSLRTCLCHFGNNSATPSACYRVCKRIVPR